MCIRKLRMLLTKRSFIHVQGELRLFLRCYEDDGRGIYLHREPFDQLVKTLNVTVIQLNEVKWSEEKCLQCVKYCQLHHIDNCPLLSCVSLLSGTVNLLWNWLPSASFSLLFPHSLSFLPPHISFSLAFKSFSVAVTEFSITRPAMKLNRVCARLSLHSTQSTKTVHQHRDITVQFFIEFKNRGGYIIMKLCERV